ncbi:MAG: hypothetical protein PSU94_04735 [Lacunisphaera sp.]|nr:hypothetical protein [Lacunisphaera sp.]
MAPSSPPASGAPPAPPLAADWWWAAGGSLLWVLALMAVRPTPFAGLDFVRISEPYLHFLGDSLRQGEMPWWNPYASLGRPFLADLQTASFYPPMLLTVVLGVRAGFVAITFLHGMLALLGFTKLVQTWSDSRPAAWGGALVFLFSAPLLARMQAGQVNYVYSLCYLPLVLGLAARYAQAPTRRGWVGLAVVWGLQLLSCHPQVFWLSALGAGLFVTGLVLQPPWPAALRAWVRTAGGLVLACVAGMALIGFVLVPFAGLIGQSNRAVPSLAFSASFAMSVDHWMSLFTTASGTMATNWEYDIHLSVAGLIGGLVALTRWREPVIRGAGLMIIVSALIMAGEATPFFGLLYKILPGLASFRVPARAGVLVVLGLVFAASYLAGTKPSHASTRTPVLLAGLLVAALVVGYYVRRLAGLPGGPSWLITQLVWLAASVGGWWLWLGRNDGQSPAVSRSRRLLLPAVIAGQFALAIWSLKQLPGFPVEFPVETVVQEALHRRGLDRSAAPARVCLPPDMIRDNSGMVRRYATLTGFESLSLQRVWVYLHRAAGAEPNHAFNTTPDGRIYAAAEQMNAVSLTVSLPAGSSTLRLNAQPDPRAYLATRLTLVPDAATAIARMVAGHRFHEDVLVEEPFAAGISVTPEKPAGSVSIPRFSLNSVELDVDSPGTAVLVVAEAWYPGWRASIDGRDVPCRPVNGWMRGVAVPAGHSLVRLRYEQEGRLAGLAVSAATALLLLGIWRSRGAETTVRE